MRLTLTGSEVDDASVRHADGRAATLTRRESALLTYLASRPGEVVTREALLVDVFEMAPTVRSRAVDVAVRRLREKVEVDAERPDHVVTVYGQGYRFVPRESGSIPDDPTFVGRVEEVARLWAALDAPGVIAVIGPPGVGKTRLARRVLDGRDATWVDLTPARSGPWVVAALARALAIEDGRRPLAAVAERLSARAAPTLVLDNCEGAAADVDAVVADLRARVPTLRVLATSRKELVADHAVNLGALGPEEAAAMFRRLAAPARPSVVSDPAVATLVAALEYVPLAITLAAGRIGVLSVRAMIDRTEDRFRLLHGRGDDGRVRSLEAALASSWELATAREREVLCACAVFRGGFTADAVHAVLAAAGRDGDDVDGVLEAACASSLLEWRGDRFGGYAFVREYVAARLAEDPEQENRAHEAHVAWCLAFARRWPPGRARSRWLAPEAHNLVAASARAVERADQAAALELARAAADVLGASGPYPLALTVLDRVAALPGATDAEVALLQILRFRFLDDRNAAESTAQTALDAARRSGVANLIATALRARSIALRERGAVDQALLDATESVTLARAHAPDVLADVLETLGALQRLTGAVDDSRRTWDELATLAEASGDALTYMNALGSLAVLERRTGDLAGAERRLREVVELAVEAGALRTEATARSALGSVLLDLGELDGAAGMYRGARKVAQRLGDRSFGATLDSNLSLVASYLGDYAEAEQSLRRALEVFAETADERQAALAQANLGELLVRTDRAAEALSWLHASADWLRDAGDPGAESEARASLGEARLALGDLVGAADDLAAAEVAARASRAPLEVALVLARRGLLELATGVDPGPSLAEARQLAGPARPTSDVGRALARLDAAIQRGRPGTPMSTSRTSS